MHSRVFVRYSPSADTRDFLATWGPAIDRRLADVVRTARRLLGAGYRVEWDDRNARCSGAVRELSCPLDAEDYVDAAFREAWDHCTARWDRAVIRRRTTTTTTTTT